LNGNVFFFFSIVVWYNQNLWGGAAVLP